MVGKLLDYVVLLNVSYAACRCWRDENTFYREHVLCFTVRLRLVSAGEMLLILSCCWASSHLPRCSLSLSFSLSLFLSFSLSLCLSLPPSLPPSLLTSPHSLPLSFQDGYDYMREKYNLSHPFLLGLTALAAVLIGRSRSPVATPHPVPPPLRALSTHLLGAPKPHFGCIRATLVAPYSCMCM